MTYLESNDILVKQFALQVGYMFTKDFKYSILLDFYGDILSGRQKELMDYYYNYDYSLSEIAEITGLSRQGIRDSIKKGETKLLDFEEKLSLASRFSDLMDNIKTISLSLNEISVEVPEEAAKIDKIKEELNSLKL